MIKVTGATVITDKTEKVDVYIDGGIIRAVTNEPLPYDELIDAEGKYLSAGFVDTHVHGGGGFDFLDGTKDAVKGAIALHFRHGTTSIMPTTCADSFGSLIRAIKAISEVEREGSTDCHIVGIHLEGPYFAPSQAGAQEDRKSTRLNSSHIR